MVECFLLMESPQRVPTSKRHQREEPAARARSSPSEPAAPTVLPERDASRDASSHQHEELIWRNGNKRRTDGRPHLCVLSPCSLKKKILSLKKLTFFVWVESIYYRISMEIWRSRFPHKTEIEKMVVWSCLPPGFLSFSLGFCGGLFGVKLKWNPSQCIRSSMILWLDLYLLLVEFVDLISTP